MPAFSWSTNDTVNMGPPVLGSRSAAAAQVTVGPAVVAGPGRPAGAGHAAAARTAPATAGLRRGSGRQLSPSDRVPRVGGIPVQLLHRHVDHRELTEIEVGGQREVGAPGVDDTDRHHALDPLVD